MSEQAVENSFYQRAEKILPAGGFGNFDPDVFITRAKGSHVWDQNGKRYIDYLIGSGPMLVGHGHREVIEAVEDQIHKGMTYFANNPQGLALAEEIGEAVACADQVRFVSTGGEADMYAMRLARAYTGRNKILKFEGGYHGMSGEALMSLSPKRLVNFPQAVPDSAGIPDSVRDNMVIAPYNDIEFARQIIAEYGDELACVIVEPLQRIIPPVAGFLETLRQETKKHGIVLIFDEVVTGFRLAYGGGQEAYGVTPDLCTLGKVIGGGFPLAAIAGSADIMAHFDKAKVGEEGFTMQVGTLSGNPVASVAGLKTMEILKRPGTYEGIAEKGKAIMTAISDNLNRVGIAHQIVGNPCLFDVIFSYNQIRDYRGIVAADTKIAKKYNFLMRKRGILKADAKMYISTAHSDEDIDKTIAAIKFAADNLSTDGD